METITFVVSPIKDGGGYEAVWDDPQLSDSITVRGATRQEARERASDALINWIAYRGAYIEVDLQFVDAPDPA